MKTFVIVRVTENIGTCVTQNDMAIIKLNILRWFILNQAFFLVKSSKLVTFRLFLLIKL